MYGDGSRSKREFETYPGMSSRIGTAVYQLWHTTTAPTTTQIQGYEIAKEEFEPVMIGLKEALQRIDEIESKMTKYEVPYTPGISDKWKQD